MIEPFSVPPEFAERGVTGQVIASRLLDRLSEMSDQTVSIREPSTYANNWNGDIKVQIPQSSPHWADPLKGWGDVLMGRNDARGAVGRYEAALDRAPHWTSAR